MCSGHLLEGGGGGAYCLHWFSHDLSSVDFIIMGIIKKIINCRGIRSDIGRGI